jgi:hypothetical protein
MEIELLLLIIWVHFVADFILQTNYIALNKSKYINCLLIHSGIYSVPFLIFGLEYAIINGILHFIIDYFSSAMTAAFYANDKRRYFWLTIGCDQAIHMTCLILTAGFIKLMF